MIFKHVDCKIDRYDINFSPPRPFTQTYTYELKKPEKITNNFSIAYCKPGVYLLYHTNTFQTITMGKKGEMKKLAHMIEKDFIFDGLDKWVSKDNKTVIRSLSEIY